MRIFSVTIPTRATPAPFAASITSTISPYRSDRDRIRQNMPAGDFVEIHVKASLAACEARDPKGLYKKARAGGIADMTGIGSPYEAPVAPEMRIDTTAMTAEEAAEAIVRWLEA